MSNRLFQGVIHQMKDAIDRTVGVVDETGTIISCSELGRIGEVQESSLSDVFTGGEVTTIDSFTYRAFGTHMHPEYAVFVEGTDDIARRYVDIIAVALSSISSIMMKSTIAATSSKRDPRQYPAGRYLPQVEGASF